MTTYKAGQIHAPTITTSSSKEEPLAAMNSDGEVIFSTKEYQELKFKVDVLMEMVNKKEFKKKVEELKIIKELSK